MTQPAEAIPLPHATWRDTLEWTLPFAIFMLLLVIGPLLPVGAAVEGGLRVAILGYVIAKFSWKVLDLRVENWGGSMLLGIVVFFLWILPDLLSPEYRGHWLLQNSLTGVVESSFPESARANPLAILFRAVRAIIIVPVVEELFWRGWLMRWLVNHNFTSVRLGQVTPWAFIATALLFASEHGSFWDVGLMAGVGYNWWMMRTRRLGDLVVAHSVTNACLVGYVLATGEWQYL